MSHGGFSIDYKNVAYIIKDDKSGLYADIRQQAIGSKNPFSTDEMNSFRTLCYEIADFIYQNLGYAIEPIVKDNIEVWQGEQLLYSGEKRFGLYGRIPLKYKIGNTIKQANVIDDHCLLQVLRLWSVSIENHHYWTASRFTTLVKEVIGNATERALSFLALATLDFKGHRAI